MKILYNNNDLNEALNNVSNLGFVPTMGSLHDGHISLIKKSKKESDKTIVSIFVNPNQFNSQNDFIKYPRNQKKDLSILRKLKVNFVYIPRKKDIYGNIRKTQFKLAKKDKILCAKYRKGHFEGVIDVMQRLSKIIKPKKIFMGDKDYQQLYLVKKYVGKKSNLRIINCKTIRDTKKLALSSRNALLNKKQLNKARNFIQEIIFFKKSLVKKKNLGKIILKKKNDLSKKFNVKIDYLELRNKFNLTEKFKIKKSKIFVAYYINKIRLIDNFDL